MRYAAIGPAQYQESRMVPLLGGSLSDQFGRQGVIELNRKHQACVTIHVPEAKKQSLFRHSYIWFDTIRCKAYARNLSVSMRRNVNNL